MTEPVLSRAEIIQEAARWFALQHPRPTPVVPTLCRRFDLSPLEAVEALREATLIHGRAM